VHVGHLVREKDSRVPDLQVRMHERLAIGAGEAAQLLGAECPLVEFDGFAGALDDEVRRQGAESARNGVNPAAHCSFLSDVPSVLAMATLVLLMGRSLFPWYDE